MNLIKTTCNGNRLTGTVQYADGVQEEYWFECNLPMSESGNHWVAALLPLAATLGETLEIPLPVDSLLLTRMDEVLRLWRQWSPRMHVVAISAPEAEQLASSRAKPVAAFFSAGVDSFFTALRYPECRHFILCQGFDFPVRNSEAFARHAERVSLTARNMGGELVVVRTNLRETRWAKTPWELISHGPALNAVGLLLEQHFGTVLIPSTYDFTTLHPWGSHPLLDPLYSTHGLQFMHDGSAYTRVQKTRTIARHEVVRESLHVCFRGQNQKGQDDRNCSRCSKCYRTMLTLDLLGLLGKCPTFTPLDPMQIPNLYLETEGDRAFFKEIRQLATEVDRFDIVKLLDQAARRSRWVNQLRATLEVLPGGWRLWPLVKQHALRHSLN